MQEKDFKEKLSEVADWKTAEIKLDSSTKRRLKQVSRKNLDPEELYEIEHELAFYEINGGVNPSYPPTLLEVKVCDTPCDDCGKICKGGRKMQHKKFFKEGGSIWRQKCVSCGMTQHPQTKEFNLDTYHANKVWSLYLNQEGYRNYKQNNQK